MNSSLTIRIVDPDEPYLGLAIAASNGRFAGSANIYADVDALVKLAAWLDGFPCSAFDRRSFELGFKDSGAAGGFLGIVAHADRHAGAAAIELEFIDGAPVEATDTATFSIRVEAAGVDRFVQSVRAIQGAESGEATLHGV